MPVQTAPVNTPDTDPQPEVGVLLRQLALAIGSQVRGLCAGSPQLARIREGYSELCAELSELTHPTAALHRELGKANPDFWKLYDLAKSARVDVNDPSFPDPRSVVKEKIATADEQSKVWYREILAALTQRPA